MIEVTPHKTFSTTEWKEVVGFIQENGRLRVSFPKVYSEVADRLHHNKDFRLRHTILLVRTLHRYCLDPSVPVAELEAAIDTPSPNFLDWLSAAAAILDEYVNNGLYWIKETRFVRHQSGAISWNRTIATGGEIITDDGSYYLSPIYRSRTRSRDNILFRLHASLVEEISLWLTGTGVVEGGSPMNETELAEIRHRAGGLINDLRRDTFSDRGKMLLSLIAKYLQVSSDGGEAGPGSSLLCRNENFELIWEHMLRSVVRSPDLPGLAKLPEGKWVTHDGTLSRGVRPRIDFSYGPDPKRGITIIFDAKDKKVQAVGRSGSEQDHYKQIIYALLSGISMVESALVFPTLQAESAAYPLRPIGCHEWAQLAGSRVHEVAASYVAICNAYLERRRVDPAVLLNSLL